LRKLTWKEREKCVPSKLREMIGGANVKNEFSPFVWLCMQGLKYEDYMVIKNFNNEKKLFSTKILLVL
jgi:hypothetical protein